MKVYVYTMYTKEFLTKKATYINTIVSKFIFFLKFTFSNQHNGKLLSNGILIKVFLWLHISACKTIIKDFIYMKFMIMIIMIMIIELDFCWMYRLLTCLQEHIWFNVWLYSHSKEDLQFVSNPYYHLLKTLNYHGDTANQ